MRRLEDVEEGDRVVQGELQARDEEGERQARDDQSERQARGDVGPAGRGEKESSMPK